MSTGKTLAGPRAGGVPWVAFTALLSLFVLISFAPRISLNPTLSASFWGVTAILAGWSVILFLTGRRSGMAREYTFNIVSAHYVQTLIHLSIFIYWSFYWELVAHIGLLILAQLLFAYLFDMLLSWSRHKPWRIGFGPFPIVFSTNLFLCFKDEWFYWQFALIALAFLAKEFITWERDGRKTHIFNPSAFSLFIFALVLLGTGSTHLTWAQEIAVRLNDPQYIYLYIFFVGLIVQALFRVTLVTLTAALALFVLNTSYTTLTGSYWFLDAGIPIAVFLGLHLLVTDPVTSPRNNIGRCLFGLLYGVLVFGVYGVLELMGQPSFYDKLLCVPLLNVLVISLDRLGREGGVLHRLVSLTGIMRLVGNKPRKQNLFAMTTWVLLFALMYKIQLIGPDHPGQNISFWQDACEKQVPGACRDMQRIYHNRCAAGSAPDCGQLADSLILIDSQYDNSFNLVETLTMGCEWNDPGACVRLDEHINEDIRSGIHAACEKGREMACYVLGTNYLKGIGGEVDLQQAIKYTERSCREGLMLACTLAGDFHQYGVGVDGDIAGSIHYYARACEGVQAIACEKLSAIYGTSHFPGNNPRLSVWYRRRACAYGLSTSCE